METITIQDPGYPWHILAPVLLAILVGILLFGAAIAVTSTRKSEKAEKVWATIHSFIAGLTLGTVFLTLPMVIFIIPSYYDDTVRWEKVDALEELGYAEADIEDDGSFVANQEGNYFKGILVPLGDNAWQIVERGETK